jgi:hypothetical protein
MAEWRRDDVTAVRPDDLAAAAGAVLRFRRRRRATAALAVTTALAAVVSSRALVGLSTTSLRPADAPPPATAPPSPPAVAPAVPSPSASPAAPGSGPRTSGRAPEGHVAPVAPPVATAPSGTGTDPAGPGRRPVPERDVLRWRQYDDGDPLPCSYLPTPKVCGSTGAAVQRDGTIALRYTVCYRDATGSGIDLTFADAEEVDFVVRDGTGLVWQWSARQRFPAQPHGMTLSAGKCMEWRTTWNGRLDDGGRVPPGTYQVRASSRDTGERLPRRLRTNLEVKR